MDKKYLVHVPTEQYGFISCELEGTAEDAMETYKEISQANKPKEGISPKEFNSFLDCYLSTGSPPDGGITLWEEMSDTQKIVVNEIKKTFKRINK